MIIMNKSQKMDKAISQLKEIAKKLEETKGLLQQQNKMLKNNLFKDEWWA